MRKLLLLPIALLLCGFACPANPNNLEQNARDTSAALGGLLTQAQAQYMTKCTSGVPGEPAVPECALINRGVQAQNALITATETYCSMPVGSALPSTTCVPVSSAQAGLQSALTNANQLINEIKGVVTP